MHETVRGSGHYFTPGEGGSEDFVRATMKFTWNEPDSLVVHFRWSLCTLLATTDSPPFLLDLSLIYLWYLKGGRLSLFIYLFIYWETAECETKFWSSFDWRSKRLENRLVVPASFLVRTNSWPSNRPKFLRQDLSYEGSVHSRRHSSWQTEKKTTFFLSRGLSEQLKEAGWTMVDLNVDVLQ